MHIPKGASVLIIERDDSMELVNNSTVNIYIGKNGDWGLSPARTVKPGESSFMEKYDSIWTAKDEKVTCQRKRIHSKPLRAKKFR